MKSIRNLCILLYAMPVVLVSGCSGYVNREKKESIDYMEKEYGEEFNFLRVAQHGDFDIGGQLINSDFYVTASVTGDETIYVKPEDNEQVYYDNYLSYFYSSEISEYYKELLTPYFKGDDIECSVLNREWMHKTEFLEFDEYMEEMRGHWVTVRIDFEGEILSEEETSEIIKTIGKEDWSCGLHIRFCSDGQKIYYTSEDEQNHPKDIVLEPGYESSMAYGVFLSYEGDLEKLSSYKTVVIDAQYYSKEEIESFKNSGHEVLSYINIGSIEDFRPYYSEYEDLTLDAYENWDEEKWIDVSNERWQDFVMNSLATKMLEKGIDGFFVDNCDVYYHYQTDEMLEGVSVIMKSLVSTGKSVLINGGDVFLDAYCDKKGEWSDVITGINQETVISKIDWDNDTLTRNSEEDRRYYSDYIEKYSNLGADVFLLEYTTDKSVEKDIRDYCRKQDFSYYISDSVELDL